MISTRGGISDSEAGEAALKLTTGFTFILCSRNPRADYLRQTLAAIDAQTLSSENWDLVVVDSESSPPLAARDFGWPKNTTFVRAEKPGVARARAAGVRAATREWIVFVDDDNVLDPDYLAACAQVIHDHPVIALFCGRISARYETTPPDWLAPFARQLAIIDFPADTTSHVWDPTRVPCWTAGMCIRRDIATEYVAHIANDPFAMAIKTRVEDVYLVMRTVSQGKMVGLFRSLHLRHLIPSQRMTVQYLCAITTETAYNLTILRCRDKGSATRDFLRPIKWGVLAFLRHGLSPAGRIKMSAEAANFIGALHTWRPPFRKSV